MASKFSTKRVRERYIRVPDAPTAIFHVKPMPASDEVAFDKTFQTFDRQSGRYIIADPIGHMQTKSDIVILGWTGLPGDEKGPDGKYVEIPFSTETMHDLCETAPQLIASVLRDAGSPDAVEAEVVAKN